MHPVCHEPTRGCCRFGKSLLAGSEDLFRGLHIHDHWDWDDKHPVVTIGVDVRAEPA